MSDFGNSMRKFVIQWNNKFPLDYWYRIKFKIRFGSAEHRALKIQDIAFAYLEEKMMQESYDKQVAFKKEKEEYLASGVFLKKQQQEVELTPDEIDNLFNNLDLSTLNSPTPNE